MDAEQKNNVAGNGKVVDFAYDDGSRMIIRTDTITGVYSDGKLTTIYFNGNSFQTKNPLNEVLIAIGWFRKHSA